MNNDFVVSIATLVDNYSHSIVDYLNEASLLLSKNFQHYEIILIIRKSIINDREILKNHIQHLSKIRIIELANNCDEDIAYSAALNSAIGDAVVLMDFIQDSLSLVPHMLNKIFAEETDVIIGNNISEYKESFWSRFLSKFFYKCAGLLCDQSVDFDRTHFSCYSRSAVNFMLQYKSNIRNLRLLRQLLGLKTTMINYAGTSNGKNANITIRRFFSRIEEIFHLSVKPLRVVSAIGFILAMLNISYIVYIVLIKIFGNNVNPGWASISLTQSVVFLALFFSISIIASYLNIISQEIQKRPLYTITHEWLSDNALYDFSRKNVVDG